MSSNIEMVTCRLIITDELVEVILSNFEIVICSFRHQVMLEFINKIHINDRFKVFLIFFVCAIVVGEDHTIKL